MADGTWKCDFCTKEVPQELFDKGKAVVLLGRHYCEECAAEAIRKSKSENFVPMWRTPRPSEIKQLPKKTNSPEGEQPSK